MLLCVCRCRSISDPLDFLCVTGADGGDILAKANEDAEKTAMFGFLDSLNPGAENLAAHHSLSLIGFFFSSFILWLSISV